MQWLANGQPLDSMAMPTVSPSPTRGRLPSDPFLTVGKPSKMKKPAHKFYRNSRTARFCHLFSHGRGRADLLRTG